MAKKPLDNAQFEDLLDKIRHQTDSKQKKFELLYYSKGYFNGYQASTLINSYRTIPEKVEVMKILESRLCRMNCAEAREVLHAFPLTDNDRLFALNCVKRCLVDHHSTEGMEYILSAFEFERDKLLAMGVLQTVSSYVADQLASGGHQGYAPVGGLYSQNWPLNEHLYGPLEDQMKRMPGQGEPAIAAHARPGKLPSLYSSHPSYAYSPDKTYTETRGYPGARQYPEEYMPPPVYPAGGPPLGYHQASPAPTGFGSVKEATTN